MCILRAMKALRLLSVLVLVTAGFAASAAEKVTYYHLDALGSPVAASDEQGNLVWREEYKPYGERIKKDPNAAGNTRYYTGHPHDEDTGLTYAGARYYDPVVGRFMAVDPKPFSEERSYSFNRYAYAANNPYRFRDPDGRDIVGYELQTFGGTAGAEVLTGSGQVVFQAVEYGSYAIGGISLVRAGLGLGRGLFRAGGNLVKKGTSNGKAFPDRALPRDKHGNPVPETNAPHTQLGTKQGRNGKYPQAREFDANGKPVRDIDFTSHGRAEHPNPHQHRYIPNETGGTPKRGSTEPLQYP